MKKLIISLGWIFSLWLSNYSSAWFIDFTSINQTLSNVFNPILNFFVQIWNYISTFLAFLWDLISWLYYWFNTIISHLWQNIQDITWLSFFSDNSFVFADLSAFLWISASSLFNWLFLCAIFLVCMRFVYSLIPFFHK